MFDIEKWQEIGSNLWQHKFRTVMVSILVGWGIFMLVFLLGAGKGLQNGVMQGFQGFAKNAIWVWTWKTELPHNGLPPGRRIELEVGDIDAIKNKVEGVEYITPRLGLWGTLITRDTKSGSYDVQGVNEYFQYIESNDILEGRYINKTDVEDKKKVVCIGRLVAENLFGEEDAVGQYINIKGAYFLVVGVYKSKASGENAKENEETIIAPYTAIQQTFNMGARVGNIIITIQDGYLSEDIADNMKAAIYARNSIHPDDEMAVQYWSSQEEYNNIQGLFIGINGFVLFASLGTIIAGIISITVIMLITVKERTKEIGVRKALGATPFSVVSLVAQEALVITAVSGFFGLIAGMLLIQKAADAMISMGIEIEYFANPEVDVKVALWALGLFIVAGFVAGLVPAIIAARIKPIEALRTE